MSNKVYLWDFSHDMINSLERVIVNVKIKIKSLENKCQFKLFVYLKTLLRQYFWSVGKDNTE